MNINVWMSQVQLPVVWMVPHRLHQPGQASQLIHIQWDLDGLQNGHVLVFLMMGIQGIPAPILLFKITPFYRPCEGPFITINYESIYHPFQVEFLVFLSVCENILLFWTILWQEFILKPYGNLWFSCMLVNRIFYSHSVMPSDFSFICFTNLFIFFLPVIQFRKMHPVISREWDKGSLYS